MNNVRTITLNALFDDLDKQTTSFALAAGLHCKSGCGHCCTNPDLETTIAEMMPMACFLWENGQAEGVLKRLEGDFSGISCVIFQPDPNVSGNGRCDAYAYRPGICRLFGFCARTSKSGQKQVVTCKIIKESQSNAVAKAQKAINNNLKVPLIDGHALRVYSLDPLLGKELMPINLALRKALERVGMALQNKG